MQTLRGSLTGRRYVPEAELGRGGFAVVLRCVRDDGAYFAVKQLRGDHPPDVFQAHLERHLTEVEMLRSLPSRPDAGDAVVGFVEELEGAHAFVIELVEGAPFQEWAARHLRPLPLRERWRAFGALADRVLELVLKLHTDGIIHRDLTSGNLLVRGGLADYSLRLIDFGIAKRLGSRPVGRGGGTLLNVGMGTPGYAAPEQLLHAAEADERVDVFAAAVLLAEAFTGANPFGMTPTELESEDAGRIWQRRVQQEPALGELVAHNAALGRAFADALQPDRHRRTETIRGFRLRLRAALDESAATWTEVAARGDVIIGWRPPPHGGRGPYLPVRIGPGDSPGATITAHPDGILVESAVPRRIRIEVAGRPLGGTVPVVGRRLLPWVRETPGAWHDVLPDEGHGPAVRVTRPRRWREIHVRLEVVPGSFPHTAARAHVHPSAEGIRFFSVTIGGADVHVEDVPVTRSGSSAVTFPPEPHRGGPGFVFADTRVLVVWDDECEPSFAGAFQLAADGAPCFVRQLRADHQARVEHAIHQRRGTGQLRSEWPWPARVAERVRALATALHEEEALRPCVDLLTADARTWIAASRVLSLHAESVGAPLPASAWREVFATAAVHAHAERDVLLYPANPTPRRVAAGGQTRLLPTANEPGLLARQFDGVADDGGARTARDVYDAQRLRMGGARRPAIELAWVTPTSVPGTHLALHGPDILRIGRWDRANPPHVALLVSDRVSRACASVALLEERVEVHALVPYVALAGDLLKVYDPAFQRACPRCGARWDSAAPTCVDAELGGAGHGATVHRPIASKVLRLTATAHPGIGNGGQVERVGRTIRAYVATHCFEVVPGVIVRATEGKEVFLHAARGTVRISGAPVPVGECRRLEPGATIEVPALGLEILAFASAER